MAVPTFAQVLAAQGSTAPLGPTNIGGQGLTLQSMPGVTASSIPGSPTDTSTTPTPTTTAGTGGASALTAAQTQAQTDFANGLGTSSGLIKQNIDQNAGAYNNSILDYLSGLKQQQHTIDSESTQNELARQQGHQSVLDMVGNGIKSGGVILANKNAGGSSASDALARAYSVLGRQQESSVGNQFAQGQNKINTEQGNLAEANSNQVRHSQQAKVDTINGIVNDATSKLTALNQMAMYASIPDRVDIDAKIAEIRQQAMDALTAFDQTLSGGIASTTAATPDQTRASADALRTAGVAPENSFSYTSAIPAQFQSTGPFASDLPIFTNKKLQPTVV